MNYYIKLTNFCLTTHEGHGIIGGLNQSMRGGAVAARRAHNPKVAGSSPAPAIKKALLECLFILKVSGHRTSTHNPQVTSMTSQVRARIASSLLALKMV
jgi:hypothetical protein